tara:strand:+ start:2411 stop:4360 length:1950 start_codon:yes stop_codon:yes gene_type:complete
MIKRYFATKDNTITNAFKEDLTTRGTGSNMGASDVVEVFSIYGQAASGSAELSRVLLQFDMSHLSTDRSATTIPGSGSVSWFLKMYDAPHSKTVPRDYTLVVSQVSSSWQEGYGLDMENYEDITRDNIGSSWVNANNSFASASATITALSKTAGQANTRVLSVADSAGNSVSFAIDNSLSTSTATKIAFANANSNANQFATNIAAAVNAAMAASTLNVSASSSDATVTLTQTAKGIAGNSAATIVGTAVSDSVLTVASQFSGGDGEWATPGGDFRSTGMKEQSFTTGLEDLDLDVTHIVENWLDGGAAGTTNYGFGIYLTSSLEAYHSNSSGTTSGSVLHNVSGSTKSYYTKRFFGRESEFFFKRPVLEARWDDSRRDDRGNFYFSSSLAPAGDNLNTIYLYNYVRGRLRDIPSIGTNPIHVSLFSGSSDNTSPSGSALALSLDIGGNVGSNNVYVVTGSRVATGIYAATFAMTGSSSLSKVFDVWFSGSTSIQTAAGAAIQFSTGSISPNSFNGMGATESQNYVLSMPNLRNQYRYGETPKMRLYVREKNWSPNIYTVANQTSIPSLLIESASYQIKRAIDDEIVVPYGTGSLYHTGLSYDVTGNYFKLDTRMFEQGYQYEIYYAFYNEDTANYVEQPYKFKFRVSEE